MSRHVPHAVGAEMLVPLGMIGMKLDAYASENVQIGDLVEGLVHGKMKMRVTRAARERTTCLLRLTLLVHLPRLCWSRL
jgi:hypothetical protein